MENEKSEINDKESEYKYIKNICYDMDSNKLTINDCKTKEYKSDIFGRKCPRFLPNISGQHNRYMTDNVSDNNQNIFRKKKLLNLRISSYASTNNSIENNKYNSINKKIISYTPMIRKFEGYSKFPRPRAPPLINIPDYELKEKQKRKIIDNLSNYFDNYSVRNDLSRKNENNGLYYLTKTVNDYDIIKHDTEKLQTLIKNNLDDIKLKYQLKKNMYKKDRIVKALNDFNFHIYENKDSKTINGRTLPEPNDKIKRYYKIINSMMKKNKNKNKYILNEKIKNKNLQKTCKKFNIRIITDEDNKDFTLGKTIKLNFGSSFEEENNKNKLLNENEENKNEIDNIDNKQNNEESNLNKENVEENPKENKQENNEENKGETNEENKDENNQEEQEEEDDNKMSKILNEKIKNNELSFISYISENEKKNLKKNDIPIKSINLINNKAEHENKLLEGYIEPPIEDSKIFQKAKILKLKTEGDLYKVNLNLLKRTNKKAFLLQEKKDMYDLELLKKKLRNQAININNAMGIKHDHKFKNELTDPE